MATAPVKEGAGEDEEHLEDAVVFCFEHMAYGIVGEESLEDVGKVRKEDVNVAAGGGGLLLIGGENGA